MKSLRTCTALTLTLLSVVAPAAFAVGDPNTDTGVGSSASRGPFGFSNNNDVIFDTPVNSYGVYRDVNGGLRDRGMIPDNLITPVPEQTWQEAHANRGPMPGGGAPGGLGGAGGGSGGGIPFGLGLSGIGGLAGAGLGAGGIGGVGAGLGGFVGAGGPRFGGLGNAGLGVSGTGPTGQIPRTPYGFAGTPGTYFNNFPAQQQRYMGYGSGFLPFNNTTTSNTTTTDGGTIRSEDIIFQNTSAGPVQQKQTMIQAEDGTISTFNQFQYNGNSSSSSTRLAPTNGLTIDNIGPDGTPMLFTVQNADGTTSSVTPVRPRNFTSYSTQDSNNGFSNPFVPNTPTSLRDNNSIVSGQGGIFGSGFATPATSGDARSALFFDSQATGNFGGFATPATSGSPRSVYFPSSLNSSGSLGAGFATPQTSGSERSVIYGDPNSISGLGGFAAGAGGGISAGTGNRAGWGNASGNMTGQMEDVKSNGAIARSGSFAAGPGSLRTNGTQRVNPQLDVEGGAAIRSGFLGPLTVGGGAPIGTMGSRMAVGATFDGTQLPTAYGGTTLQRVIIPDAGVGNGNSSASIGSARPPNLPALGPTLASPTSSPVVFRPVLAPYVYGRMQEMRLRIQTRAVAPEGPIGNLTTMRDRDLATLNLSPDQAIGQVIGSMRYSNGDIITFGSKGTLRLAPDNSGSITLNNGEILTFKQASAAVRSVALRSALFL